MLAWRADGKGKANQKEEEQRKDAGEDFFFVREEKEGVSRLPSSIASR